MENRITAIEVQKNNKNRVNVFIDNDYSFSCDAEIIFKYGIKTNQGIEQNELMDIVAEDNFIKAKNSSVAYIQKALKTEKEVINKLKDKGYDEKTIARVMEFMKEYNFVNDENYVKAYIKTEMNKNGMKKITYNLLKKGISQNIINNVINDFDKEDEINSARTIAEKKYKSLVKTESDNFIIYNKMLRYLTGRGYSYDIAKRLSKEIVKYDGD